MVAYGCLYLTEDCLTYKDLTDQQSMVSFRWSVFTPFELSTQIMMEPLQ